MYGRGYCARLCWQATDCCHCRIWRHHVTKDCWQPDWCSWWIKPSWSLWNAPHHRPPIAEEMEGNRASCDSCAPLFPEWLDDRLVRSVHVACLIWTWWFRHFARYCLHGSLLLALGWFRWCSGQGLQRFAFVVLQPSTPNLLRSAGKWANHHWLFGTAVVSPCFTHGYLQATYHTNLYQPGHLWGYLGITGRNPWDPGCEPCAQVLLAFRKRSRNRWPSRRRCVTPGRFVNNVEINKDKCTIKHVGCWPVLNVLGIC